MYELNDTGVTLHRSTMELLLLAEQILDGRYGIDETAISTLTRELIALYDMPFGVVACYRQLAARAVAVLASGSSHSLDLLIDNAQQYINTAGDPYTPNSLQVLAETKPCGRVVTFLRQVIETHRGVPQWEAIAAMSRIDPLTAEETCKTVKLELYEVHLIEQLKGSNLWAKAA